MSKLTAEQKLEFTGILKGIRGSRAEMWRGLDAAMRLAIPAVLEGDNISLVNRFIKTMDGSKDKAEIVAVVRKFVPYKVQDGEFTTMIQGNALNKAREAYREWCKLGRTLHVEIQQRAKASKPVKTAEELQAAAIKRFEKDAAKLAENGMTLEEIIAILTAAIAQDKAAA
jgi:hypothetical protein